MLKNCVKKLMMIGFKSSGRLSAKNKDDGFKSEKSLLNRSTQMINLTTVGGCLYILKLCLDVPESLTTSMEALQHYTLFVHG